MRLPPRQLSDVAEGLNYLHSCNMIHGGLKGVRDWPRSRLTTISDIQPVERSCGHLRPRADHRLWSRLGHS